ncbi:MAG: GlsB/YeaQ/YmgE family stress response membrane protein [Gaiellaceae bacterium]
MVLWYIIVLVLEGLVVGGLARLALPGPDPMSIPMTIGLGLVGTFLGGIVSDIFLGHVGGIIFSLLGATVILYLHRRFVQHRPLTGPGARQLPPH